MSTSRFDLILKLCLLGLLPILWHTKSDRCITLGGGGGVSYINGGDDCQKYLKDTLKGTRISLWVGMAQIYF